MILRDALRKEWDRGAERVFRWAFDGINNLNPKRLMDVGCHAGDNVLRRLECSRTKIYGIEGSIEHCQLARKRGISAICMDLNQKWTHPDDFFDVIHAGFVIEHLHNTRLFVTEMHRTLRPGGTAFITSENLGSLLNWLALSLGYTPFTLANCCGWITGNPFSLVGKSVLPQLVNMDNPAFPGIMGHVRALSVPQAEDLFTLAGFEVDVSSIGLLPFPTWASRFMEGAMRRRGHFLMIKAVKPL